MPFEAGLQTLAAHSTRSVAGDLRIEVYFPPLTHPAIVAVERPGDRRLAADQALLSPVELERAETMAGARRAEFVRGRSLLRRLLRAEGRDGAGLMPIETESTGRPRVRGAGLGVSLSHTAGWTAAAICPEREVGIDVQDPPARLDQRLVRRCAGDDSSRLQTLAMGERMAAFARLWAAQEACIKAVGLGLAGAPWRIPVPVGSRAGTWGQVRWLLLDALEPTALAIAVGQELAE